MNEVLSFWFDELSPEQWWKKDDSLDAQIKERFLSTHEKAMRGELWEWRSSARGRLAEILVLDQFSRNIFRNTPQSFASDTTALVLAQECIHLKKDQELSNAKRSFIYMPIMHSESLAIHQEFHEVFLAPGLEGTLEFEIAHKEIIEKFGRYPHRNSILGRESTPEEIEFLKRPGSSF